MSITTMEEGGPLAAGAGGGGVHSKKRRVMLELEGLPYDPVERIHPDGSVVMLPPQDPEDEFARRVAYMRAQEAKKKAAEEGNDAGQEFAWKDTVDMVRAAAGHARQLSLLLDLVGNRNVVMCAAEQRHVHPLASSVVAKAEGAARAQAAFATAAMRLQAEIKLDSVFLQGLASVREYWNITPLKRPPLSTHSPAGPIGALGVSLGLQSSGSAVSKDEDCDAVILREADGSLAVEMGKDFMARRLEISLDADYVPVASDGVFPGKVVAVPTGGGGTARERDRYLFECLKSVLENDVFRTMTKEATDSGRRVGIHAGKHLLAAGPICAKMHARKIVRDDEDGSEEAEDDRAARPGGSTGALEIVARQLLRCEQRMRLRYKPGQGGQVPKTPQFQPPVGSTGILPAMEQIARHIHFRSHISSALEASIPSGCVTRQALHVVLHMHRSEQSTVSRFTLSASAGEGSASPSVIIDMAVRGTRCTITTTPAVLGAGRNSDTSRTERAEGVKLYVQSTLSVLLMRSMEREAVALGHMCRLTHAAKGRSDFCSVLTARKEDQCLAFVFSTGEDVGKELVVAGGKEAAKLEGDRWGAGGGAAEVNEVDGGRPWGDLRGKTWRDKLRRALAGV